MRGHAPSDLHRAADLLRGRAQDTEAHPPVGEVDLVALVDGRGQAVPRDREVIAGAELLVGGQGQLRALLEAAGDLQYERPDLARLQAAHGLVARL